jgi:hypothetical protein
MSAESIREWLRRTSETPAPHSFLLVQGLGQVMTRLVTPCLPFWEPWITLLKDLTLPPIHIHQEFII